MSSFLSKLTVAAALALLVLQNAGAQVSVKIKLVDSRTQEAIGFATVSLTGDGKNPTVKYTQADSAGVAVLNSVKAGKYTLKGNMMGYDEYTERVTVNNKSVDMGIGEMNMQANYLDGAVISDTGNPIVVKQDTIEHNVTLMKTTADETLEDLLKRLPGIEIENGKVTANGKEIKKITVEDRTFFLNDLQMTTKNLPAKAIEKVKIIDRMSEQAQFTGIDDGEEETIIDLTMVKGARGQWFGNIMGGAGQDFHAANDDGSPVKNDFRFQGAGMAAKFGKSDQLAIVGNANNTNNRGFDDFARSMMSSVRNANARTTNNGITTSYMLGANAGHYWRNKTEVTGNYIFSGSNKDVSEHSERLTYRTDESTLDAVNDETSASNAYGHSAGVRADWKVSNRTSILFEPRFNYGYGDYDELTTFFTDQQFESRSAKVNDGHSHSWGNNDNLSTSGRVLWRQKVGDKPGRTFSLNANYSFSDNLMEGFDYSVTNRYADDAVADSAIVDQRIDRTEKSMSVGGRFSYTEPIAKGLTAELTYSYSYSNRRSDKGVYTKDEAGNYSVIDGRYSNNVSNINNNHRAGFNLQRVTKAWRIMAGVTFQPQTTLNKTVIGDVVARDTVRRIFNWAPNARIEYRPDRNRQFRLSYNGNSSQPSLSQLMPVPNNSNPQRVSLGNMALDPYFVHNVDLRIRLANPKNFSSVVINADLRYNTRNIVNANWYDKAGVQYIVPVNNNEGAYTASSYITYQTSIAKSKFSFSGSLNSSYSKGVSFVGDANKVIDPEDERSYLDLDNFVANYYKRASFRGTVRFTYRNDWMEYYMGGNSRCSLNWYYDDTKNTPAAWTNSITSRLVVNVPNIVDIKTDASYIFYLGYLGNTAGRTPSFVWNAELSRQVFKRRGTIALKGYDLLGQARNMRRTINDNYMMDSWSNTLGRYVVLSFTYRFGKFTDRNQMGGRRGGNRGGMGGRGMGGNMGGMGNIPPAIN